MTSIPRLHITPKTQNKDVLIEQPLPGCIVAEQCNGYGSGMKQSYVVVSISKSKSNPSFTSSATLCPIVSITELMVTYNPEQPRVIKPYFNKSGNVWHYEPSHRISMFTWDLYIEKDLGYMK